MIHIPDYLWQSDPKEACCSHRFEQRLEPEQVEPKIYKFFVGNKDVDNKAGWWIICQKNDTPPDSFKQILIHAIVDYMIHTLLEDKKWEVYKLWG